MTTPTFNKFKSTTIYGNFSNVDYPDNSMIASAYFQRNLSISGDLTCSGIIYGKKLYYNNVDISSTFVSNTALNNYALLSGATFNGLTTTAGANVHISCNNTFPTTNSGSKQGVGFFWNKSGGIGETNLLCYGQGGGGGLSIWASNTTNVPSKLAEFYTMGAAFSTSVQGITPATSENSTLFATTAFVKNQNYLTSASLSSSYALLSGATFTGNVVGLTAVSTDNSTKFATTAFVKAQNYISTNPDLSPYALLSGATFTGNVSGLTAVSTDNTTKFATTAFVKAQSYITSSSLSPYALSSALSNYALSSSLSNYALSSSLSNYALSSSLSNYALSSSLSAYALSSSLSNYALLSGATFTGIVNCNNTLKLLQPSSTSSAKLGFQTDTGVPRGYIYSSVDDSVFSFDILSAYNTNGFRWLIGNTGVVLMSVDLSGNLTIAGKLTTNNSTPIYSTITVPTTNTLEDALGNYWTQYSVRPTNSVTTLNGVITVNIGSQVPYMSTANNIRISNTFYAQGTVANPDTALNTNYCLLSLSYGAAPTNATNFFNVNMYNVNTGARIKGYGTLLKAYSTNSYGIMYIATDGVGFVVNTPYTYDPFQFTYT